MTLPLLHGYDIKNPEDRKRLHQYFTNYTPFTFNYRGWNCWIIKSPIGNLNGYIEINEQFCDHLKTTDDFEELEVHGGITYEGGALCIEEMKDAYVIGFDTAHFMDVLAMDVDPYFAAMLQYDERRYEITSERNLWLESDVEKELKELVNQLDELHDKYQRNNNVR